MSKRRQELSAFADSHEELNQAFLEVEDALMGMAEKSLANVVLEQWDDSAGPGATVLSFRRAQSHWRLGYAYWEDGDDPDHLQFESIANAPIHVKRKAVEKMDDLLEAIRKARSDQTVQNYEMAKRLRAFASRVLSEEPRRGK